MSQTHDVDVMKIIEILSLKYPCHVVEKRCVVAVASGEEGEVAMSSRSECEKEA
jgi:hypothetical protein